MNHTPETQHLEFPKSETPVRSYLPPDVRHIDPGPGGDRARQNEVDRFVAKPREVTLLGDTLTLRGVTAVIFILVVLGVTFAAGYATGAGRW